MLKADNNETKLKYAKALWHNIEVKVDYFEVVLFGYALGGYQKINFE